MTTWERMLDHKILTRYEEIAIAKRIEAGDESAVDELVMSNVRFVSSCAKEYIMHERMEMDDLVQVGLIGAMKAARRYDYRTGYRFLSYAKDAIRREMQMYCGEFSRPVRIPANFSNHIGKAKAAIARLEKKRVNMWNSVTVENLMAEAGLTKAQATMMLTLFATSVSVNEEARSAMMHIGQSRETRQDRIKAPEHDPIQKHETRQIVDLIFAGLNKQQREAMTLRYGIDSGEMRMFREVGEIMGVSDSRIEQITSRVAREVRTKERFEAVREAVA